MRSLGVPARNVFGIHGGSHPDLRSGRRRDEAFSNHIWSEILLPGCGWIQVDASRGARSGFGSISDVRIVLGRGEDILLGHSYPLETVPWFHSPNTDFVGGSTPPTQNWGEYWVLQVEKQ